jgi:hypothetical protein
MSRVELDQELLEGVERFIAERDEPPRGRMSYDDAVNVIVRDWLMAQGYIALPGNPEGVKPALDAALVPK